MVSPDLPIILRRSTPAASGQSAGHVAGRQSPMSVYFVAYNLAAKPGRNGKSLWDVLTALGARRIQDSVWMLRSNFTAAQVREHLWPYVGLSGRLLVVEGSGWAAWNPMAEINSV